MVNSVKRSTALKKPQVRKIDNVGMPSRLWQLGLPARRSHPLFRSAGRLTFPFFSF